MTSSIFALTTLNQFSVNSCEFFEINWHSWKLLGIIVPPQNSAKRFGYLIWSIILNLLVSISLPMHLMLSIFLEDSTQFALFENMALWITSVGTIGKFAMFALKIEKIKEMEEIIKKLDRRVQHKDEYDYYERQIRRNIKQINFLYIFVYLSIGFTASVAFVLSKERRLLFPGWLPFDWRISTRNYCIAFSYQLFGFFFEILQNFTNDSFSPKALCILSGHINLLYKRVKRVGYDEDLTLEEHELELNRCIADQMNLYRLYESLQNIISGSILLQLCVTLVNTCVAMVVLLFFVTDVYYRIYYVFYFFGMGLQLFPACYYGSDFVLLFENLHYAVFSCNWTGQSKRFKRHMMLFTERSLKQTVAMAGGLFPIHLNTFFATCKGAYSLFAVVLTMK